MKPGALASRLGHLGIALAGVVAGHHLAYGLAVPDGALRHQTLAITGHAYWPSAVVAAAALVVAILGARIVRELRGDAARDRVVREALRLTAWQGVLFLALETLERAAAGAPVATFFSSTVLPVGLAVQAVVATTIALGVGLLARGVVALVRVVRRRPAHAPRALPRPRLADPARPTRALVGAVGVRGPPRA